MDGGVCPLHMHTHAGAAYEGCRECGLDERMQKVLNKVNSSLLAAIGAPDVGIEKYRTLCDWVNWVTPFDESKSVGLEHHLVAK